jgi:FkbM family methyltransferase
MPLSGNLKNASATALHPVARLYIRYAPTLAFKRLLWRHFYWRNRDYTARTKFGAIMRGQSPDLVQGHIYHFGEWEPNLTAFIRSRLSNSKNRTFIDVGANVGYFTLLAALLLPQGQVVSIEAFPSIYEKLQTNIRLNRCTNVRALQFAATETAAQISMFHAGYLNEGATTTVVGTFSGTPVVVEGRPLADLLTLSEISTTRLIKIDVEGAEYSVVLGMLSALPLLPHDAELIIEITASVLGETKSQELLRIFENAGYHAYTLNNSYSVDFYLKPEIHAPTRMKSLPKTATDIVFSRIDAEHLG